MAFFDPNLPTRLRTDSTVEGLGAMIEQLHSDGWHPIGYKSKATTKAQKEWAPIERETLSVLFGCEIFHEYLYGRHFTAQNDHQPLKTIFNKSISQCPPRIQSLFLELQKYYFDLEYVPGSKMVVSDTFSRASSGEMFNSIEKVVVHAVDSFFSNLPVSKTRLTQFKTETSKDSTLKTLMQCILLKDGLATLI